MHTSQQLPRAGMRYSMPACPHPCVSCLWCLKALLLAPPALRALVAQCSFTPHREAALLAPFLVDMHNLLAMEIYAQKHDGHEHWEILWGMSVQECLSSSTQRSTAIKPLRELGFERGTIGTCQRCRQMKGNLVGGQSICHPVG